MKPEELINQFSKQLDQVMSGAEGMGAEVQQQLRSAMMSTFSKLDLVTRLVGDDNDLWLSTIGEIVI